MEKSIRLFAACGVLASSVALAAWSSITHAQLAPVQGSSADLPSLQQERIATLREAVSAFDKAVSQGIGPASDVNRLSQMLLEAELNAATSAQERIGILRDALADAKKRDDLAAGEFKAGLASSLAPLEAKAYRLGIEIKLAQEGAR